jgi:hypothetical protein
MFLARIAAAVATALGKRWSKLSLITSTASFASFVAVPPV